MWAFTLPFLLFAGSLHVPPPHFPSCWPWGGGEEELPAVMAGSPRKRGFLCSGHPWHSGLAWEPGGRGCQGGRATEQLCRAGTITLEKSHWGQEPEPGRGAKTGGSVWNELGKALVGDEQGQVLVRGREGPCLSKSTSWTSLPPSPTPLGLSNHPDWQQQLKLAMP